MENARKLKRSDILKPGTRLKAKKIDLNDPEVQKRFKTMLEEQEKCLERKNVDWNKLDKTYITI
jgi:hypothetical protein